ncbi:MAG TPA: hypothetical protein VFA05_05480 [Gaiellaceae bacterium]|nr:hypothetical protein [Gaiellaceae bacterium]
MARRKHRAQNEVVERARTLQAELRAALDRLPSEDEAVVEAVWRGEALGTLLWALQLVELPPYDTPFDADETCAIALDEGRLRAEEEVELERRTARLWHWRARTADLQDAGALDLPEHFSTADQLVAATAMRGYEQGLLPAPVRGDFGAYDTVYRHLTPEQRTEAHSIAVERHHALNWLCGDGSTWDDVPLDT